MAQLWRHGIRTCVAVALAATALVACSDAREAADASTGQQKDVSPTGAAAIGTDLAGTWERETRCEELVSAFTEAGLDRWILEGVAGNGFVPGVRSPDEIADPAKPCKGAVPRVHSHFFTEDGLFGSLDWHGEQVDDGTYELVGDDTFVVSKEFPDVTFHYAIEGDSIRFEPVIPGGTVAMGLEGDQITFGVVDAEHEISFTGTVSGDRMSGTWNDGGSCPPPHDGIWQAERTAG